MSTERMSEYATEMQRRRSAGLFRPLRMLHDGAATCPACSDLGAERERDRQKVVVGLLFPTQEALAEAIRGHVPVPAAPRDPVPPDPYERARGRLVSALVQAYQAGYEMGDLLSMSLCEAASKVGGPDMLLHRRLGSREVEALGSLMGPSYEISAPERTGEEGVPTPSVFCLNAPRMGEGRCLACHGRRPPETLNRAAVVPSLAPFAAGAPRPRWIDPPLRAAALERLLPAVVDWEDPRDDDDEPLTGEARDLVAAELRADLAGVLVEGKNSDAFAVALRLRDTGDRTWFPNADLVAILDTYHTLAGDIANDAVKRWVTEAGITLPNRVWEIVLLKGHFWSWDGVPAIVTGVRPETAEYEVAPLYWPACRGSLEQTLTFEVEDVGVWSPDEPLLWKVVKALGEKDFDALTELAMQVAPKRQRAQFELFADGKPPAAGGGA